MSDLEDELAEHLDSKAVPFLFVGAGMSRRYVGLDSWEGLLRHFAAITGKPYDRYTSDAEGDYPQIATLLAEDFNPMWWEGEQYANSREQFEGNVPNRDSPLKIEIAQMMASTLDHLDETGRYGEELEAIKSATIDGIITTNYDPLLEHLFPSYKPFIGQEELLFSEVQSIGEIYKIHGSWQRPDSLVLTARDYADFDRKNPYLAAKLMTIFVDHPIVFLGYKLGDRNINRILSAIAGALSTEHLAKLQDRLVYVTWDEEATRPRLGHGSIVVEGGQIPMCTVGVADYSPVYRALGRVERKLPARLLRQLKERVYELVLTSDPVGALKVVNIADDVAGMDVVFGVGAVDRLGSLGYFGVDRRTLIEDILNEDGNLDAAVLVKDVIPNLLKLAPFTPIMKYLRVARLLDDDGKLKAPRELDTRIANYVKAGRKPFGTTVGSYLISDSETSTRVGTLEALLAEEPDPKKVLRIVHAFTDDAIDLDLLRAYLQEHLALVADSGSDRTLFSKAMCLYDWLRYAHA